MRIGLLGGTFDPIHYGHIGLAENALRDLNLDKVIFVVAGISAHKNRKITNEKDRIKMVNLRIKDNPKFAISLYEIRSKEKSYSYNTMKYFNNVFITDDIFFIIGGDSLMQIESWYRYEDLLSITNLLVYKRPGSNEDLEKKAEYLNKQGYNIILKEGKNMDISSSEIRKKIQKKEDISELTTSEVVEYIEKRGLYLE